MFKVGVKRWSEFYDHRIEEAKNLTEVAFNHFGSVYDYVFDLTKEMMKHDEKIKTESDEEYAIRTLIVECKSYGFYTCYYIEDGTKRCFKFEVTGFTPKEKLND